MTPHARRASISTGMRPRRCAPRRRAAMAHAWDIAGNPSSVHAEGREARRLVEDARAIVAGAVGGRAAERGVHLGRHRGQCAGADAGLAARRGNAGRSGCWSPRSSMPRCSPADGLRPRRSSTIGVTRSGVVDLDHLRAHAGRRPAGAGVGHAGQQRDRRDPAGRGSGRHRPCGRRPAARRCDPGVWQNSVRYGCRSAPIC